MSPRGAAFELVRFTRTPVTEVVALVELEGRLARRTVRTSAPRLLVELEDGPRRELKPVAASTDDGILRASFTVPADDLDDATLALAFGGLLLDLPAPDPVPDADRIVGLTRELNALRRERAGLHEDVGAAKQRAAAAEAAALERAAAAEQRAETTIDAAEKVTLERVAAAEREADERVAAAEQAASERQAETTRAAAKRQGELERALAEREQELAEARAEAERRDGVAAAAHAALQDERDTALEAAQEASARAAELAERERLAEAERAFDAERSARAAEEQREARAAEPQDLGAEEDDEMTTVARPVERVRAAPPASIRASEPADPAPDDDGATDEHPAEDDDTAERPADEDTVERPEQDTGPVALRRGPIRTSPLPPATTNQPPPLALPTSRTLALAAVGVAGVLFLLALLSFVF